MGMKQKKAAKAARAEAFIEPLPDSYDSVSGLLVYHVAGTTGFLIEGSSVGRGVTDASPAVIARPCEFSLGSAARTK